jgi:hypothetical protein
VLDPESGSTVWWAERLAADRARARANASSSAALTTPKVELRPRRDSNLWRLELGDSSSQGEGVAWMGWG